MPIDSADRQYVHNLVEQLGPDQVAAIPRLLEGMVEPDEEPLSEEDSKALTASREFFRQHLESGAPFERFAAECGLTMGSGSR